MAKRTRTITRYRTPRVGRRPRRASKTISLAMIAGLAPLTVGTAKVFQASGATAAAYHAVAALTGYRVEDREWKLSHMRTGAFPILAGFLVHKVAGRLGVNRALGRAGIPFVRV